MKIYTKQGDNGNTRLWNGTKVSKSSNIIHTLGEMDELTVRIGQLYYILKEYFTEKHPDNITHIITFDEVVFIRQIQRYIQTINTHIATPSVGIFKSLPELDKEIVSDLESKIDSMTNQLPPLKEFILPCTNKIDSIIHLCRTQTRKAERYVSELEYVDKEVYKFLNRLSDYMFTLARVFVSP